MGGFNSWDILLTDLRKMMPLKIKITSVTVWCKKFAKLFVRIFTKLFPN